MNMPTCKYSDNTDIISLLPNVLTEDNVTETASDKVYFRHRRVKLLEE